MEKLYISRSNIINSERYIKSIANTFIYRCKLAGLHLSNLKLNLMVGVFLKMYATGDYDKFVYTKWFNVQIPILMKDNPEMMTYKDLDIELYLTYGYTVGVNSYFLLNTEYDHIIDSIIDDYIDRSYIISFLQYAITKSAL